MLVITWKKFALHVQKSYLLLLFDTWEIWMFNRSLPLNIFPPSCTQMLFLRCFEKQKFSEYISSSFLGGWVRVDTSSLWSHQVMHSNKHILSPFESGLHLLIPLLFGFVLIVCVHVCCNRNRDLRYISKNTYIKKKKCLLSCFSSFFFLFSLFFFPKDFETIYPLERENKEKINFRAEKEPNT